MTERVPEMRQRPPGSDDEDPDEIPTEPKLPARMPRTLEEWERAAEELRRIRETASSREPTEKMPAVRPDEEDSPEPDEPGEDESSTPPPDEQE